MVESTVKSTELVAEEIREDRYIVAPHTGHTHLLGASVAYLLSFIDCYDKNICDVSQFFFVLLLPSSIVFAVALIPLQCLPSGWNQRKNNATSFLH